MTDVQPIRDAPERACFDIFVKDADENERQEIQDLLCEAFSFARATWQRPAKVALQIDHGSISAFAKLIFCRSIGLNEASKVK